MPNSFSSGKGQLVEPPNGAYVNTWNEPCNSNFGLTDALISGTTTIDVSTISAGAPYVTLVFQNFDTSPTPWTNPLAGQNLRIALVGTLTFGITVYIPSNHPGLWIIDTTSLNGSFPVSINTTVAGSSGVSPTQGYLTIVFCDGTNIRYADLGTVRTLVVPVATSTTNGIVTQGFLAGNCPNLDSQGKIPYQTDKYIISTADPDPAQGSQDWLWMKV
jgi:hypothetical protein